MGAFGAHREARKSYDPVGSSLDRIRHEPDVLAGLRRAARLWHIVGDFEFVDDASIIERVAAAARSGRLVSLRAPNARTAPAGRIDFSTTAARAHDAHTRRSSQTNATSSRPGPVHPGAAMPPLLGGVAPGPVALRLHVATMSVEERLVEILHRTVESKRLSDEAATQLRALISPEQISGTVLVMTAWVASQFLGIGLVFDLVMLGMGMVMLGQTALDAAHRLTRFLACVSDASTERELDEAADLLAGVIVTIGIDVLRSAIRRGTSRMTGAAGPEGGAGKRGEKPRMASSTRELDAKPVPREQPTTSASPLAPSPLPKKQLLLGPGRSEQQKSLASGKSERQDHFKGRVEGEPTAPIEQQKLLPAGGSHLVKTISRVPTSGIPIKLEAERTNTVLGSYNADIRHVLSETSYPKTEDFGPKTGALNVLNVPDHKFIDRDQFWREYNQPFLQRAVERGDNIVMATKPTGSVLDATLPDGSIVRTGFGREYDFLSDQGYTYDPATSTMVKVKQ